jgi:hypothetical protein
MLDDAHKKPDLQEMVTRFYQSIFTRDPEKLVPTILSETASVFEADIATWFLVTEDKKQLVLVDVYNDRGERTRPAIEPYDLNWDASSETDIKGLTASVAISGKPLFVDSLISLEKHKEHKGKWDKWLYPDGVKDPMSGFLCLYAVPLFLPVDTKNNRDKIVGVVKLERRMHRKRSFSEEERKAFDVIANIMGFAYIHSERQRALTLIDIGHTLIRPLGDVAFSLELVAIRLGKDKEKFKGPIQRLNESADKLRGLSQMLSIVKDSFNNPTELTNINLNDFLGSQAKIFSLQTNHDVVNVSKSEKNMIIDLTKMASAALMNLWSNLIDNAIRNSDRGTKIEYWYSRKGNDVTITLKNKGLKIPDTVINRAQDLQHEPDLFKGLPRAYQLAVRNGWKIDYERNGNFNIFSIVIPSGIKGKGGR